MARARSTTPPAATSAGSRDIAADVAMALAWLERRGSKKNRDGMARYGIVATKAFGVSMATMQTLAKRLGRDHALALALWETGWYEARILTAFVGEPSRLTATEMDRWCRDFDNWAICDTLCFHLFDKSPHAWGKVGQWARRRAEFEKRAAFTLLAALALHDKAAPEARFRTSLRLIVAAATDERNFVKKGVSWALRAIGHRSLPLHGAASDLAATLARSDDPTARWVGKDVLRDLQRPAIRQRLEGRRGVRPLSG
jgi:3-methyladenine DNA glycosylase AlkD